MSADELVEILKDQHDDKDKPQSGVVSDKVRGQRGFLGFEVSAACIEQSAILYLPCSSGVPWGKEGHLQDLILLPAPGYAACWIFALLGSSPPGQKRLSLGVGP